MKLKFYSKFIVLLLSVIPQCFSATLPESESVAKGRAFITQHDNERCRKYNNTPGEFDTYKKHTGAIDTLLGDKSKVKQDEIASDEMIRTIITAVIDKEITHRNDASKPESQVEQTLSALNPADPLYGHFTVLSLFEKAAAAFVTGTVNIFNSSDIGTIVNQADSFIQQITGLNARITKTAFTDCLTITYGKHKTGITAVVTAENEALRITAAVKEQERLQKLKEAEEEARRVAALKVEQEEAERVAAAIQEIVGQVNFTITNSEEKANTEITDAGLEDTNIAVVTAKETFMLALRNAKAKFDAVKNGDGATDVSVTVAKEAFDEAVEEAQKALNLVVQQEKEEAAQLLADTVVIEETEEAKQERIAKEEAAAKLAAAKAIVEKGKPVLTLLETGYYYTDKDTYNLPPGTAPVTGKGQLKKNKDAAEKANSRNKQENIKIQRQYDTDLAAYNAALEIVNAAKKGTTTA